MKKYLLGYLIILSTALAQPAAYIQPGSKPGTTSGIVTYNSGDTIEVGVAQDHSIFCGQRSATFDTVAHFSSSITCAFTSCGTITGRLVGSIDNGVTRSGDENHGLAFTAPLYESFVITLTGISPNPGNLIIECVDTTLFGNFNTVTAANPFNFLEISNDTVSEARATVILFSNAGVELTRFNVNLTAHQQRDIAIHDISGAANTFGTIMISHNSAPNAIRASVTKYTSSFTITASNPLVTKPNNL